MNTETEIKILNIDPKLIRKTLLLNNAKKVKKVFQRNIIYSNDYVKSNKVVVRLRQEGKKCWLTVKSPAIIKNNHKIRKEYEMLIPSYKEGHEMLLLQGFNPAYVIEIKREYFSLYSCSVEILITADVPPFIEIEGKEANILRVAKLLGYSNKDYITENIFKLYNLKNKSSTF